MSFTLCLNTSTIKPTPIMDKIRLTAEAGFPAIELWVNEIYEYIGQGGEVGDIEKSLADHGLSVPCMIASRGWAEASEFERPHQMEDFKRRLELATRIGSPWLVCSPARFPCDIGQITRRYKELLEIGRVIGAKPTFEYISFSRSVSRLQQAWHVVRADDKKRARLNCISHFLSQIPYKKLPREKITLGKRDTKGKYDDQAAMADFNFVPEKY